MLIIYYLYQLFDDFSNMSLLSIIHLCKAKYCIFVNHNIYV